MRELELKKLKKKVFLNGRFLTQQMTGVQRAAHELIVALDELLGNDELLNATYEVVVIYSGKIISPIELKNISLLKKGFLKGNLWEQLELPVYTRGHLLISMAYISCLLKKKQIIIMHDAGTFSHPYFFKTVFRTWYKFAISVLARFSLHIITVSEFSKKALVKHTGIKECKITVIKNSPEHIKRYGEPDIAFKRKVEELIPFFLGVSSVHPHKNFEILSKAIISANLGEYRVVIAGGSYGKSFDKVILDDSIVRLGYVSNEELKHLYSRASLFIFPSLFEGFGIPPLEAMTVGCPVLSSYSTAMPEVLGDACEYFNPKDEKELVIKLEMLINNKARLQELQRKGYERVPLYSWQNSAEALLKLVKEFA